MAALDSRSVLVSPCPLSGKNKWKPHASLSAEAAAVVRKAVDNIAELHYEEPRDEEQYAWTNSILDRLQDYALTQGFAVVTLSGSHQKGRMRFGCIHHGKPRDTRKLDKAEAENATERKRETTTQAKGCPCSYGSATNQWGNRYTTMDIISLYTSAYA